jgi:hypothetical protein
MAGSLEHDLAGDPERVRFHLERQQKNEVNDGPEPDDVGRIDVDREAKRGQPRCPAPQFLSPIRHFLLARAGGPARGLRRTDADGKADYVRPIGHSRV